MIPERLEATLRQWTDHIGASIRTVTNPDVFFGFEVALRTGQVMAVSRERKFERQIVAAVNVTLSDVDQRWLVGLSDEIRRRLIFELESGLLMLSVEYMNLKMPFNGPISISARAPIAGLNEDRFRHLIMEVVRAQVLIAATLNAYGRNPDKTASTVASPSNTELQR